MRYGFDWLFLDAGLNVYHDSAELAAPPRCGEGVALMHFDYYYRRQMHVHLLVSTLLRPHRVLDGF